MNYRKPNYERAKAEANQVLLNNFLQNPPVIAEVLARNYGLFVKNYNFKPEYMDVSGFIDPQTKTIIVNAEDSPQRKNFTIAHELGHYLLGHVNNPDYDVLYRRPIAEQTNKPLEQEANCFAANLLVPEQMLRCCLEQYPFASNLQIANIFGVSADVIGYRRQNLGI